MAGSDATLVADLFGDLQSYEEEAEAAQHIAEQGEEAGFSPAEILAAKNYLPWVTRKAVAERMEAKADLLPVGHVLSIEKAGRDYSGTWIKNEQGLWDQQGFEPFLNCDAAHLGFVCGEVF